MFSSIAENLLQNIIDKRHLDPDLWAAVSLSGHEGQIVLEVVDTGSAVPPDVASDVFSRRIVSENGLGIGLYQCSRLAAAAGYRLELAENRQGCVRFRLAPGLNPDQLSLPL